jgi:hypothetical protein
MVKYQPLNIMVQECHLQGIFEHERWQVQNSASGSELWSFVILCFRRLPEDGTPVPKNVGVGTYHELCFILFY